MTKPKQARPLTAQQQRFVEEYPVDLNATKAAERAGYSQRTAYAKGSTLLKDPRIKAAIAAAIEKRSARTELTQDYVITNLRAIVERCMGQGEAFEPHAAVKALHLLGKHLNMFVERVEVGASDSLAALIVKAAGVQPSA